MNHKNVSEGAAGALRHSFVVPSVRTKRTGPGAGGPVCVSSFRLLLSSFVSRLYAMLYARQNLRFVHAFPFVPFRATLHKVH